MKLERVLALVEAVQEQGGAVDPAKVSIAHDFKEGYAILLDGLQANASVGAPCGGWPWIEPSHRRNEDSKTMAIRWFKTADAAIDDAIAALTLVLKNKVEVLDRDAASVRKALG